MRLTVFSVSSGRVRPRSFRQLFIGPAFAITWITLLALPGTVLAQLLEPVVVTASRVEQRVQDALPSTTLITRADIERSQTLDLPALLRQVGGLEIAQTGGAGTFTSVFMRGADSRHTLVLIDGVPVNNLSFNTAAIEHLSLADVDRIEIVRGNVSSLYGSAALGGVIQIFTRQGGAGSTASASLQAGSRATSQAQVSAAIALSPGTRLTVQAESLNDGGFNAIDQTKRAGTNPDVDGYQRRALSVGLTQLLGSGKIALNVRESRGTTAYDSQFGPATQADESTAVLRGASLTALFPLGEALLLDAAVTQSADRLNADVTAYPYFVNSLNEGTSVGLRWRMLPGQNLTAGVETSSQSIESDTVYNASSRQMQSGRLGYQADVGAHQFQVNVRQDRYSDFGSASTWFAGYGYRLTEALRANVSASTGFMAPTFNDLYYPYGGNAGLRPEQLRSEEFGLQYVLPKSQWRAVWFNNRYTDLIGNDADFNRVNVSEARNSGLELSAQRQWQGLNVRAGLTSQDPIDVTAGKRLALRAANFGYLGVSTDWRAWSLGGNLRFSGERTDGTQTLAAYGALDLTASLPLTPQWRLTGRIDNALDAKYETVYGYNQAPIGVFVGITWKPKP